MSHLRTLVAAAAVSCFSLLALTWPTITQATGPENAGTSGTKATIDPDAAEVGPVLATSKLVPHPKYKGVYNVEVAIKNPSRDQPCEAKLDLVVYAQVFSEDSRGGPMPQEAWKRTEGVKLAPDQVVSKVYVLPADLSFRVHQAQAAAKKAEATGIYPRRGVSYYVNVLDAAPPQEENQGA